MESFRQILRYAAVTAVAILLGTGPVTTPLAAADATPHAAAATATAQPDSTTLGRTASAPEVLGSAMGREGHALGGTLTPPQPVEPPRDIVVAVR